MNAKMNAKKTLNIINKDTWVISDLHLGHNKILDFEQSRKTQMQKDGFDNHEEWLIWNWNKTVKQEDTVLCLGDFAFKGVQDYTDKLNGNKILVIGNHDGKYYNKKYKDWCVIDGIYYSGDFTHKITGTNKYDYDDEMLSAFVKDIEIDGEIRRCLFSHYPVYDDNQYDRVNKKIAPRMNILEEVYEEYNCDLSVHGHVHSKGCSFKDSVNVSLENINFKPIKLGSVIRK